ncbi:DUF2059 domain-containing protein [Halopseudomonas sp.]|uniref:DUF2059 domain-containing protein n=1 Tax=Halopseudomonas sp. TaxID=2901191 RepID=UPI00311EC64C
MHRALVVFTFCCPLFACVSPQNMTPESVAFPEKNAAPAAAPADPEVLTMLEVMGIRSTIQAGLDRDFLAAIAREPAKASYYQCMMGEVTAERIVFQLAPTYREVLGTEEIEQLTVFYRSPTGQKMRLDRWRNGKPEASEAELAAASELMESLMPRLARLQGPAMHRAVAEGAVVLASAAQRKCGILLRLANP